MKARTWFVIVVLATPFAACLAPGAVERPASPQGGAPVATGPAATRLPMPQPTEHRLAEGAEKENKRLRKAWMRHMHRTGPEVDWEQIERTNGMRELRRRRLIARNPSYLSASQWTEVGSRNQAGRMHCAVLGPPETETGIRRLYAGSSKGGVWRGDADGSNWVPLGDNLYGGAHEILVIPGEIPGDPDVVLAATDGGSVHVTRDLGVIWETPAGLSSLASVRGVATLADVEQTLLIYGNFGSGASQRMGLFASTDYGRTFVERWSSGANGHGSIWVPRRGAAAADTVYLIHNGKFLVSTNSGGTFALVSTIDQTSDRSRLAGSEAGAPTIYATLRIGGQWKLYRSLDAGQNFSFQHDIDDFWESLNASSYSSDHVMYGGVEAHLSTDGGSNFAKINNWWDYYDDPVNKLHADIPGIYCWPDPDNPFQDIWYIATDGGLFRSLDQGATVANLSLNGLGVSQYYTTHTSTSDPSIILAGAQDQGYQRGILAPSLGPGPSSDFDQLISGDYGHMTSSDGTHNLVYSTYPGFILVQEGETNPDLLYPWLDFPAGSSHAWLPPVVADPLDPEVFYFLGDKLTRYTRVSGPDWGQAEHSSFNFAAGPADYMSAMAFAPSDPQRVYAANDDGGLFYSSDHGQSWTESSSSGPDAHYFYGSTMAVHPTDAMEAAVGGSGYSVAGVRRTTDGGLSWQAITNGLPPTLVYGLVYAGDGSGDLFAATEAGAYHWDRGTDTWSNIMSNVAPITLYWSVESVNSGEIIRFGTYGRGIWDYRPQSSGSGRWVRYGLGLGGANILDLDSVTPPNIGSDIWLDVAGANGPTMGWVFWSAGQAEQPGWGGTLVLEALDGIMRMPVDVNDDGSVRLRIPDDPALISTRLNFQSIVVDGSQTGGYALSNGLQMIVGY